MNRNSLAKVGAASHVSCIDRRVAASPGAGAVSSYRQLADFGLQRLEGLCALLGARPTRVMARCGATTSEVFLELQGNLHLQYFGALGASHDEQTLWVEGPRGSMRADGSLIWWRKRGWPKFLPWRLRPSSSENPRGVAKDSRLLAAIIRASEEGKVIELGS